MFILKVGGGKEINWDYIAKDLTTCSEDVVIVHGANSQMKDISVRLGIKERIIKSPSGHISRYTDDKTMELLTMVYSGLVNKKIVACLQKHGMNAIGLTGADGKLWLAQKKEAILSTEGKKVKVITDSRTGKVISVNTRLISLLHRAGYIPVITIPAITKQGELINVDNDRTVAVMARDLPVKTIVMLFETPGLLSDINDERSVIPKIDGREIDNFLKTAQGRMRKKLLGVKEAFSFGVEEVYFGDGRIPAPVTAARNGNGTVLMNYHG